VTTSAPRLKNIFKPTWKVIQKFSYKQIRQRWVNRFFKQKSLLFVGWGRVEVKRRFFRRSPRIQTFWLDINSDKLLVSTSVFSSVVGWVLGCRSDDGEITLPDVVPERLTFPTHLCELNTEMEEGFESFLTKAGSAEFSWKMVRLDSCVSWVPQVYMHKGMANQRVLLIYKDNKVFVLPLFELARTLFLNKSYLAREAFNPTVLPDFFVHGQGISDETGQKQCAIECSKSVPKNLFSSEETGLLTKITQILLVPTFKSSYGSIFIKMVQEANNGLFDFELPDLSGVELELNVQQVQENVFFVTEILGLENLPSFLGEVTINFPFSKKKEGKPVTVTTPGGKVPDTDSDTGSDDSGDSKPGMSRDIGHIHLRKVVTSYRNHTKLYKVSSEQEKSSRKQKMLDPVYENIELIGGFTEKEWGGKLAQMEFDSIDTPIENDFVNEIKSIAKKNNLDCLYEVYKVPNAGSGRYHLIDAATGERRKAMCFSFKPKNQEKYDRFLIELERLEGESISTLMIYASPSERKILFKELLALCNLRKGHWSDDNLYYLKSNRSDYQIVGFKKIKHKKMKVGPGLTEDDLESNKQTEKNWYIALESKIKIVEKDK
jgi:hypothetical protein